MSVLVKHYKIYPDKTFPNRYMIDIYEKPDDLSNFERVSTNLSELSVIIHDFERLGYIADFIEI